MSNKVFFVKDTSLPNINLCGKTICVYREGYKLPIIENCDYFEFSQFKKIYTTLTPDNIVIVGLNKIFIPSIRCDLVFEYLQTMTTNINKISIDTAPFVGEPWRCWIHYSMAFGQWLGVNYSYAVETNWQKWFYLENQNCWLLNPTIEQTNSDLEKINTKFNFYQPDIFLNKSYLTIKEIAFNQFKTPKQIINFMLKEFSKLLQEKFTFDDYLTQKKKEIPDFGIFRFYAQENLKRQKIYNQFCE